MTADVGEENWLRDIRMDAKLRVDTLLMVFVNAKCVS